MKTESKKITLRRLTPDTEGNWLYKQEGENRVFSQEVYLGKNADPAEWSECSREEKEQWENEHTEVAMPLPQSEQ